MPHLAQDAPTTIQAVGANADGKLPEGRIEDLDRVKELSQEAEDDVPTSWQFAGETLHVKAHGSGRQWS